MFLSSYFASVSDDAVPHPLTATAMATAMATARAPSDGKRPGIGPGSGEEGTARKIGSDSRHAEAGLPLSGVHGRSQRPALPDQGARPGEAERHQREATESDAQPRQVGVGLEVRLADGEEQ